jgi:periplasmic protein TonB
MNTITFDGGVKRRFVLPAAIVLSSYAALFLGFVKSPAMSHLNPPSRQEPESKTIDVPLTEEVTDQKGDDQSHDSSQQEQRPLPVVHDPILFPTTDIRAITIPSEIPVTSPRIGPWSPLSVPGEGRGPDVKTYNQDLLDHTPEAVRQQEPIYPWPAKQAGETGEVVVTFVVDESGRVLNPRVVSSTGRIFEEPTVRAIGQWRFAPGTVHGVPVRFRMSVPVAFRLDS